MADNERASAVQSQAQAVAQIERKFLQTWTSWAVEGKIKRLPLELNIEGDCLKQVSLFHRANPFAVLYTRRDPADHWNKLGVTDIIPKTNSPKFVSSFRFDCTHASDQALAIKMEFYSAKQAEEQEDLDRHVLIGTAETLLRDIVAAPKQQLEVAVLKDGKDRGRAAFLLDVIEPCRGVDVTFRVMSSSLRVANKRVFFVVSKGLRRSRWTPVYISEVTKHDTCAAFAAAAVTKDKLVGGDDLRAFKIELFMARKYGPHLLLGSVQIPFGKMTTMKPGAKLQYLSNTEGLIPGGAILEQLSVADDAVDAVIDLRENTEEVG